MPVDVAGAAAGRCYGVSMRDRGAVCGLLRGVLGYPGPFFMSPGQVRLHMLHAVIVSPVHPGPVVDL